LVQKNRVLRNVLFLNLLVGTVSAANPIHYSFKENSRFGYHITVEADAGDVLRVSEVRPIFTVKDVADKGAKVVLSRTSYSELVKRKPNRPVRIMPTIPRVSFPTGVREVMVDGQGQIISQRGTSQLPFALGDIAELVIHRCPEDSSKSWGRTEQTKIRISSSWPPRPRILRDDSAEIINAEEEETYKVINVTDQDVTVERTYTLETVERVDGQPRMEMDGKGTLKFERSTGWPLEYSYQVEFVIREENQTTKYPIQLTMKRQSEDEILEFEQKMAEAAAARVAPPSEDQRDEWLKALKSDDKNVARSAMSGLYPKSPESPDPEIAAALAKWLTHEGKSTRLNAVNALKNWATEAEEDALIKALGDDFIPVPGPAGEALGRLKSKKAVQPLTEQLLVSQTRYTASKALKMIGPAAEEEVLKLLDNSEWQVRLEATRILTEVGTPEGIARLKKVAESDANALVKLTAKSAIEAIDKRQN